MKAPSLEAQSVAHAEKQTLDQYRDNVLIDACGPILSPPQIAKGLLCQPPRPNAAELALPAYIRRHAPLALGQLHLPKPEGLELAQCLYAMLLQGYVDRNPKRAETWRRIYCAGRPLPPHAKLQLGATVEGISGAGKSSAIERALALVPQVAVHDSFPHLTGRVKQLVWLKVDVPFSGRLIDLVLSFAEAADIALGTSYASDLVKGRATPDSIARSWLTMMEVHFPGLLVIDELQNLFKIETKRVRDSRHQALGRPALRIKDDDALKFLLTITNASKIPLVVCGTPDGVSAIKTRTSTTQRLVTGGYHQITHANSPDDVFFRKVFFPKLLEYQWLPRKLQETAEARALFHQLSAGVPRIGVSLWVHATRRAIARGSDGVEELDLRHAAAHDLALLQAAVQALNSADPRRMQQYEDLLPSNYL